MKTTVYLSLLVIVLLSACAPAASPTPQMSSYQAPVQSVEVLIAESNPVQVRAVVRGQLSATCDALKPTRAQYSNGTFMISLMAITPVDHGCAPATEPYELAVPLDTKDLPAGRYSVNANGVTTSFVLDASTPTTPQPTAPAPTTAPTSAPTSQPSSGGTTCIDSAAFVSDVSIPDGFRIHSNVAFTKIWRLKNTGSCTWDSSYQTVYISGTTMTQVPNFIVLNAGQKVLPGQTLDVSISMLSPIYPGEYTSSWVLKNGKGQTVPITGGASGNSFFVKIQVDDGNSPPGYVTTYRVAIDPEPGSTACQPDSQYVVTSAITANGPVSADYTLTSGDGQTPAGNFISDSTELTPSVQGTVAFQSEMFYNSQPYSMYLERMFVGPFPDPKNITVGLKVDYGKLTLATVVCP